MNRATVSQILPALAILSLSLSLCGCPEGTQGPPPERPPASVLTAVAASKDIPMVLEAFGNVEAYSTIEIKAQVGGILMKISFTEGDDVKAGDVLYSIDPRPFETALKQAEAILDRDGAQLKNSQLEVRRFKDLAAKEYASPEEYDRALAAAEALAATVRADQAVVDTARIQLGHCTIRSPIDGRAGRLLVNQGNLVKANADTPMVILAQVVPIFVAFSVPEKELAGIRRLQAASPLAVEALGSSERDLAVPGSLAFINNTVDTSTGTILLKAVFANKDRVLWPGQFVTVKLHLMDLQGVLVVPSQAVQTGQKGSYIAVVKEDSRVEMRPITVVLTVGQEVVVEGDLKPGEVVVTEGHLQLSPGTKVQQKRSQALEESRQ